MATRQKHIDKRAAYGEPLKWIKSHLLYDGDDCLTWPFCLSNHGYGNIWMEGKAKGAHRVMLELVAGPAPSPKHHAAHECGKGHLGCTNPRHLRWKSAPENQRDRLRHGTNPRGWKGVAKKLDEETVLAIRRDLMSGDTIMSIAARYGIGKSTVHHIKIGSIWRWLKS